MAYTDRFMLFTFVFMRMTGCIGFNPIFGRRNISSIIKAGFIFVLSMVLYFYSEEFIVPVSNSLEYGILLLKELAVGFIIGSVMNFFLYVIIFAGEILDLQMGISMSKIYDAQSNTSIALTATFYNILFIFLFFTLDGHLTLLQIILTSSRIVPYGSVVIRPEIATFMLDIFCQCTVLAVKFTFPLLAIEFLTEIGVGILMKVNPQINVFVVNIQMKILVGFIIILLLFTPLANYLVNLISLMLEKITEALVFMR